MNMVQIGFIWVPKRLQPKFGVLNPLQGFTRIFAREGLAHLVLNVLKLGLVLAVAWSAVVSRMDQIMAMPQMTYLGVFGLGASVIFSVAIRVALLMLFLAGLDYGWERFRYERQLRMTKQEIREEMRHMEGDPKIKHAGGRSPCRSSTSG